MDSATQWIWQVWGTAVGKGEVQNMREYGCSRYRIFSGAAPAAGSTHFKKQHVDSRSKTAGQG